MLWEVEKCKAEHAKQLKEVQSKAAHLQRLLEESAKDQEQLRTEMQDRESSLNQLCQVTR